MEGERLISVETINGLGVADVVDAMGMAFEHRAHIIRLDSPNPERVLFGPAVTIGFLPVRKDLMDPEKHSLGPAFYRAIGDDDPAGRVLVMASNGHPDTSLGGGTKLSRLQNHKLAGLLCDGTVRDYEELQSYDFAVYCKGETVRTGGNEIQPYLTNVPVSVDGVTIVPGDYIFAQGSSAVVLPAESAQSILTKAQQIVQKLNKMKAALVNEDPQQVLQQGSSEL